LFEFKNEGLGFDQKVFQEPEKLHLTLCVVMLLDQVERKKGAEILEQLKPELMYVNVRILIYISNGVPCLNREMAKKGNLRCRLQGIEIMNDDPTQVNILFAKCVFQENDTTVQVMADFIHKKFLEAGK